MLVLYVLESILTLFKCFIRAAFKGMEGMGRIKPSTSLECKKIQTSPSVGGQIYTYVGGPFSVKIPRTGWTDGGILMRIVSLGN